MTVEAKFIDTAVASRPELHVSAREVNGLVFWHVWSIKTDVIDSDLFNLPAKEKWCLLDATKIPKRWAPDPTEGDGMYTLWSSPTARVYVDYPGNIFFETFSNHTPTTHLRPNGVATTPLH